MAIWGELGENEVQLHEEVGEHAGKCDIDVLICTGKLCRNMAERAQRTNPDLKVIYEPDRESLLEHLEGYVQDGDTILVKASHFMKFEEVVTKLGKYVNTSRHFCLFMREFDERF